jgi:hypothetical protein
MPHRPPPRTDKPDKVVYDALPAYWRNLNLSNFNIGVTRMSKLLSALIAAAFAAVTFSAVAADAAPAAAAAPAATAAPAAAPAKDEGKAAPKKHKGHGKKKAADAK